MSACSIWPVSRSRVYSTLSQSHNPWLSQPSSFASETTTSSRRMSKSQREMHANWCWNLHRIWKSFAKSSGNMHERSRRRTRQRILISLRLVPRAQRYVCRNHHLTRLTLYRLSSSLNPFTRRRSQKPSRQSMATAVWNPLRFSRRRRKTLTSRENLCISSLLLSVLFSSSLLLWYVYILLKLDIWVGPLTDNDAAWWSLPCRSSLRHCLGWTQERKFLQPPFQRNCNCCTFTNQSTTRRIVNK